MTDDSLIRSLAFVFTRHAHYEYEKNSFTFYCLIESSNARTSRLYHGPWLYAAKQHIILCQQQQQSRLTIANLETDAAARVGGKVNERASKDGKSITLNVRSLRCCINYNVTITYNYI